MTTLQGQCKHDIFTSVKYHTPKFRLSAMRKLLLVSFVVATNTCLAQGGVGVPPLEPFSNGINIGDCSTTNGPDTAPWAWQAPEVVINYGRLQSIFGGSSVDLERFERDTLLAIEKWRAAGLPFDITYGGLSAPNQFVADPGQILISAASYSTGLPTIAGGASSFNAGTINFLKHHQVFVNGFPAAGPSVPWTTGRAPPSSGKQEYLAVLMHELGHVFGLCQHDPFAPRSTMATSYGWSEFRHGPYKEDMNRIRTTHAGQKRDILVRPHSSPTTSLTSWFTHPTISTSHLDVYDRLGVLKDLGLATSNPKSILTYTQHRAATDHPHPGWMISPDGTFASKTHWRFTGLKSWFGTAIDGEEGEYLWAYVDHESIPGSFRVRVLRTTNGAASGGAWSYRDVPGYTDSLGTPGIAHLYGNTWLLAYATMNEGASESLAGTIVYHLTTNDGATWSPQYVANTFYRAIGDVSLTVEKTGTSRADVFLSFLWDRSGEARRLMRTLVFDVNGGVVTNHPQHSVIYGVDNGVKGGAISSRNDKTVRVHRSFDGDVFLQIFSAVTHRWEEICPKVVDEVLKKAA